MTSARDLKLAKLIDHTLLKPEAQETDIKTLCREAREYGFYSVCVERKWLRLAATELQGSGVLPITVIAFPTGEGTAEEKRAQALEAVALGAQEVDMVLNRKNLADRNYALLHEEISQVVEACAPTPVKVILETSELEDSHKTIACAIAKAAGASFVKTSTGFSKGGATEADVRLMRGVVGDSMGVKASGAIRDTETALRMVAAGASRLGTSASVAIVKGLKTASSAIY